MSCSFSAQRLAQARVAAGLRREAVAAAVDRSSASIRLYELGEVDPPASLVGPLAAAVGVDVAELFEDVDR